MKHNHTTSVTVWWVCSYNVPWEIDSKTLSVKIKTKNSDQWWGAHSQPSAGYHHSTIDTIYGAKMSKWCPCSGYTQPSEWCHDARESRVKVHWNEDHKWEDHRRDSTWVIWHCSQRVLRVFMKTNRNETASHEAKEWSKFWMLLYKH